MCPVYQRLPAHRRLDGVQLSGKLGLGADEVYLCQQRVGGDNLLNLGAHLLGKLLQYADDFAAFLVLQFAYAVVGFHHLRRLDIYRLARCRLVVDDALHLPLHAWGYGDDQSAVAQGGGDVLVNDTLALGSPQDMI